MNPRVLQALEQGVCVATATRRLAYEVKSAYSAYQLAKGKTVWPSPLVTTWDGWMQSLWLAHSAHSSQLCLSAEQLQQLFVQIIEADIHRQTDTEQALVVLWNIPLTAKTAFEAWQLCNQWHISFSTLQDATHADHASFGRWATQLYAKLKENNWVCTSQIADILITENASPEQATVLFGFDYLNPQQHRVIEHFNNVRLIQSSATPTKAKHIQRYAFENTLQEWQHIGAWARSKLHDNPQYRLGVITPNIEKIRAVATRSLREQLIPQYFQQPIPDPFHFSQGQSLSQVPAIHSALALLGLLDQIEFQQLTPVFLSPYWGMNFPVNERARLVSLLQPKLPYQFDLFQLINAISRLESEQQKIPSQLNLLAQLKQLQQIKKEHQGAYSIGQWRDIFKQCLSTVGWPVPNLNSTEFQAYQAWDGCLTNWLKLDSFCPPVRLGGALRSLNQHCQQSQFQAQAELNAPLQVMGVLEAAELDFDAVWLAGFDEQAWPVTEASNPFIPVALQKDAGIPTASNTLHAKYAELKTAQLCTLCDEVNVSHAQIQDDITLAISPLLAHISTEVSGPLTEPISIHKAIREATPKPLSSLDNIGYTLDAGYAAGGTGLIQAQSACPFQAYAKYRLSAGEQAEPEIGIDALKRGQLLHQLLANIWTDLGNSHVLQTYIDQNRLDGLISRHTRSLVSRFTQLSGLKQGFEQAQIQRLQKLIKEWLLLEATRPAFEVIECEQKRKFQLAELNLNFTLDRVDKLSASQSDTKNPTPMLVMDYKSGKCEIKDWAGDRPDQPQIPLYFLAVEAQSLNNSVTALAFAQVKPDDCQFVGVSREESVLPAVNSLAKLRGNTSFKRDMEEWGALRPKWSTRLQALAKEFQQGLAHVDPKSAASCNYCEFSPLCRIHSAPKREEEIELS